MSPPPNPPEIPSEVRDGLLGIAIGGTSWLVRYVCSTEKHTLGYIARRTATASLTSLLVGVACRGYFANESIAFAAAGAAGYCSPELVDAGLAQLKRYAAKGKTPPKG